VQHGDDLDQIGVTREVDAVWEAVQKPAPGPGLNLGKLERIVAQSHHETVEFIEEALSKTGALTIVPLGCRLDVRLSIGVEDYATRQD